MLKAIAFESLMLGKIKLSAKCYLYTMFSEQLASSQTFLYKSDSMFL